MLGVAPPAFGGPAPGLPAPAAGGAGGFGPAPAPFGPPPGGFGPSPAAAPPEARPAAATEQAVNPLGGTMVADASAFRNPYGSADAPHAAGTGGPSAAAQHGGSAPAGGAHPGPNAFPPPPQGEGYGAPTALQPAAPQAGPGGFNPPGAGPGGFGTGSPAPGGFQPPPAHHQQPAPGGFGSASSGPPPAYSAAGGYGAPQGYGPGAPNPGAYGAPGFGQGPLPGAGALVPVGAQPYGSGARGPVGNMRNPVLVALFSFVCFVYGLIQLWGMLNELKAFRGKDDLNPILFFIPILGWIELWNLPAKVLDAKQMAGVPNADVQPQVLYFFAALYLLPSDLNEVWHAASGGHAGSLPPRS